MHVPEEKIESVPDSNGSFIDTAGLRINFMPGENYWDAKQIHFTLKNKIKAADDSIKQTGLEELILNKIIPHWYKTPWEFSGYTNIPQKGNIACGYFVSTVLKHAGFNLNRYKLAQQDPMNEARSLADDDTVAVYEMSSHQLQKVFNEKYPEGLYFAGLDFHVGFLLFRNKELYFIHSDYINARGVVFEKAVFSDAFNAAARYRIAGISTNASLVQKWLDNEEIKVVTKN